MMVIIVMVIHKTKLFIVYICSIMTIFLGLWIKRTLNIFPRDIFYNTPLELGIILAARGSISTAIRSDRAKALKPASMI